MVQARNAAALELSSLIVKASSAAAHHDTSDRKFGGPSEILCFAMERGWRAPISPTKVAVQFVCLNF